MKVIRRVGPVLVLLGALAVGGCFLFPNLAPEAAFTVNYNTEENEPLVVELDASASSSPDGDEIELYLWTFGDDVTILTPLHESKSVPFPVITVRYPVEGTYTVTLAIREKPRRSGEFGMVSTPVSETITLPHD